MHILHLFERASGQKINFTKSSLYFSSKTPKAQRAKIGNMLRMQVVENMEAYLGLPMVVGKNKTNVFRKAVDRVSTRIQGWSKRLLSYGGKEVFLKAILQSLPTYYFSVFLLPIGIIEKMESKCRNFW